MTLEDAFSGKEEEVSFKKWASCESCHGSGMKPGTERKACATCGEGTDFRSQGFFQISTTCPACGGEGRVVVDPCKECSGRGKIRLDRKINSRFRRASIQGSAQAPGRRGSRGNGGPPGDLFVVIHVKDHDLFKREGEHLLCEIPVSFVQAALGNTLTIPVLGNKVGEELHIPAALQPGDILNLPGLGMPSLQKHKRGDLFVRVSVKIPRSSLHDKRSFSKNMPEARGSRNQRRPKKFWQKISKSQ